jgi:hypothetical protein
MSEFWALRTLPEFADFRERPELVALIFPRLKTITSAAIKARTINIVKFFRLPCILKEAGPKVEWSGQVKSPSTSSRSS